jgi:transcriptional regulator with XRE-family HTH domain
MTLSEAIVRRIYEICETQGITLNKLSTHCGITQSTLNNIVSGVSQRPTVSTIKKVCDGVNMSLTEFFDTDYFNALEQEIK